MASDDELVAAAECIELHALDIEFDKRDRLPAGQIVKSDDRKACDRRTLEAIEPALHREPGVASRVRERDASEVFITGVIGPEFHMTVLFATDRVNNVNI